MSTATTAPPSMGPADILSDSQSDARRLAAWAIGGPVAMGLCFGLTVHEQIWGDMFGAFAVAMPVAMLGAALMCAPTLYIATAFMGVAPDPKRMVSAMAVSFASAGRLLVGLVPAVLFLCATAGHMSKMLVLGVIAVAGCIGLGGLYRRLFADEKRMRTRVLFAGWSLIYIAIGLYLFVSTLTA